MEFFLPEDSSFFFMRFFVRSTNPLLRFFAPVTPGFLLPALVPLYVAWLFYMLRFYLMPWLLGYTVMGMLSFPLESEIAGLPYVISGLVAAGGMAAAMSTADGLLLAIANALSHDLYYKIIDPTAETAKRLIAHVSCWWCLGPQALLWRV